MRENNDETDTDDNRDTLLSAGRNWHSDTGNADDAVCAAGRRMLFGEQQAAGALAQQEPVLWTVYRELPYRQGSQRRAEGY